MSSTKGIAQAKPDATLRVMCYNIHFGIGSDGVLDLNRIIKVMQEAQADVVVLNEVDRNFSPRSNFQDQLQLISDALQMPFRFQKTTWKPADAASDHKPREFGHAILSKLPLRELSARILTANGKHLHGVLETEILFQGQPIIFYSTHLDVDAQARAKQALEVKKWMAERPGTKILIGDLNATPQDSSIVLLKSTLKDAFEDQANTFSFPARNPVKRIDYILGTPDVEFCNSYVITTLASDHLPIVTHLKIRR